MALQYNLAELHGGPLDGQIVQVPLQSDGRPELVVGVPVPVLDELHELFWWDTGNYFFLPAANPPKPGRHCVFTGPQGATIRRSNWHTIWRRACIAADVQDLHFHDLRHTGNTLAAGTGASLRDLMARMGHSSAPAALIYQHATSERDHAIAASLDDLVRRHRDAGGDQASGT